MKDKQSPHSWEDTRTVVILKTGKQMDQLDSYQPIAFVIKDTKLLSSVLVSWMSATIKDYQNYPGAAKMLMAPTDFYISESLRYVRCCQTTLVGQVQVGVILKGTVHPGWG